MGVEMVKKVRIGRILGCFLIGLIVVVVVVVGLKAVEVTEVFARNREVIRKNPRLAVVPAPVENLKSSPTTAENLEYFGAKFKTPWGRPAEDGPNATKKIGPYTRIVFKDGQFLMAFRDFGRNGLLDVLGAKNPDARKALEVVWGTEAIRSSYELERALLNTTPQQVSIWNGWKSYWQTSSRLNVKSVELLHAETGLYAFAFSHVHGFQKGDPTKVKSVTLDVYDDKDRKCEIIIGSDRNATGVVTQEDINAILGSMEEAESGGS